MDYLLLAAILVALDYIYFRVKYAKPYGPPAWYGFPFLGMLPLFILPDRIFMKIYRWYLRNFPDVIVTRFLYPMVVVKNSVVPEAQQSEQCLSRDASGFVQAMGQCTSGKPYWFVFDRGECDWRTIRKVNIAALNVLPKSEKFERISEVVENFLKKIEGQNGRLWHYEDDLGFAKLNESNNLNLGQTFQSDKVPDYIPNGRRYHKYLALMVLLFSLLPFKVIVMCEGILPEMFRPTVFKRCYLNITQRVLEGKSRKERPRDFIEAVLRLKDPDDALDFLRETTLFNMMATTHSTQFSTMATLSFVSLDDRVQKNIQDELRKVVGSGHLKVDHLAELHYLRATIHEALRRTPPIPIVMRWTNAPAQIGGYTIDAKMRVTLLLSSESYDVKNFPNCDDFVPDRHINEQGIFEHSKHFNVFSRGKRMCSGPDIASISALVFCAKILQHFEIIPESKSAKVPGGDGRFLPKSPHIPLRFVRRKDAPAISPIVLNPGLTALVEQVMKEELNAQ